MILECLKRRIELQLYSFSQLLYLISACSKSLPTIIIILITNGGMLNVIISHSSDQEHITNLAIMLSFKRIINAMIIIVRQEIAGH